ncbi:hypothetical protein Droror1_Dr00005836 [Drosera rotundifolia]
MIWFGETGLCIFAYLWSQTILLEDTYVAIMASLNEDTPDVETAVSSPISPAVPYVDEPTVGVDEDVDNNDD